VSPTPVGIAFWPVVLAHAGLAAWCAAGQLDVRDGVIRPSVRADQSRIPVTGKFSDEMWATSRWLNWIGFIK
jgi:hypothetical protein